MRHSHLNRGLPTGAQTVTDIKDFIKPVLDKKVETSPYYTRQVKLTNDRLFDFINNMGENYNRKFKRSALKNKEIVDVPDLYSLESLIRNISPAYRKIFTASAYEQVTKEKVSTGTIDIFSTIRENIKDSKKVKKAKVTAYSVYKIQEVINDLTEKSLKTIAEVEADIDKKGDNSKYADVPNEIKDLIRSYKARPVDFSLEGADYNQWALKAQSRLKVLSKYINKQVFEKPLPLHEKYFEYVDINTIKGEFTATPKIGEHLFQYGTDKQTRWRTTTLADIRYINLIRAVRHTLPDAEVLLRILDINTVLEVWKESKHDINLVFNYDDTVEGGAAINVFWQAFIDSSKFKQTYRKYADEKKPNSNESKYTENEAFKLALQEIDEQYKSQYNHSLGLYNLALNHNLTY